MFVVCELSGTCLAAAEAFPAAEGERGLFGPVSGAAHQPAQHLEVGAAQSHHRTSLRREPQPSAELVRSCPLARPQPGLTAAAAHIALV